MSYFKQVQSLDDLKEQFKKLAREHHPDAGGDAEIMKQINQEYDTLFPIWKHRYNMSAEQPTEETAYSTRSRFYTENGWEGDNYDAKLTLKEIAKIVRTYVKEEYPTYKFSVRIKYASMVQELHVDLLESPIEIYKTFDELTNEDKVKLIGKAESNNYFHLTSWNDAELQEELERIWEEHGNFYKCLNDVTSAVISDVDNFVNSYNYDDSDGMIDYFDNNFYYFGCAQNNGMNIKIVPKTARIKNKEGTLSQDRRATPPKEDFTEKENGENTQYNIEKSKHTKTGEDIWLVRINDKLERDDFLQEKEKMKELGGYYSKYTHSFVFKEDPSDKLNENFVEERDNVEEMINELHSRKEEKIQYIINHKEMLAQNKSEKTPIVINAYGGPGAGKSTACMDICSELKKRGYDAEYVQEYAKELVYEKNFEMLDGSPENQFKVLKEQTRRLDRLYESNVDFIVTDSPILLNTVYNKRLTPEYSEAVKELYDQYINFSFFMERDTSHFQQEGRIHNLEESIQKDGEIRQLLKDNGIYYGVYHHDTVNIIIDNAVSTFERINPAQIRSENLKNPYFNVNEENKRIQLRFEETPSENVRELLKQNKFRWDSQSGVWYRYISVSAKQAVKRIIKGMDKLKEQGEIKERTNMVREPEQHYNSPTPLTLNTELSGNFEEEKEENFVSVEANDNFKLNQVSVRLNQETPLYSDKAIKNAEDAVKIVGQELMANLDREQICIINLNTKNNPINFSIASVGTLNNALAEPREMLKASILSNAGSVIMLHNHPSGNYYPSVEDYQVTERIIKSFDSVGIKVLDHVIIAGNNIDDYYSMREENVKMFEESPVLTGKLEFSDISEHLLHKINVFLVAEDLSYWINNTHSTISLTDKEAEIILNYMDGHGYNLGVENENLVRIDVEEETPTAEKYNINEAIYAVCDWNAELISETNENINNAASVEEVCKLREYMKALRADESVIDAMFKKTSLGKTLELGTEKQEEKKTEHKKEKAI